MADLSVYGYAITQEPGIIVFCFALLKKIMLFLQKKKKKIPTVEEVTIERV